MKMLRFDNSIFASNASPQIGASSFETPRLHPYLYGSYGISLQQSFTGTIGLVGALSQVREYGGMPEGWDGDGARQISSEAVKATEAVLTAFSWQLPAPEVSPNANGTLSLEWETSAGSANIEIGKSKYAGYVSPFGQSPIYFGSDNTEMGSGIGATLYGLLFGILEESKAFTPIEAINGR